MNVWIAALLGLVQGLCEFLPVSSSGHLVLLQRIFGVSEGAFFFTTMLHLGTLVAVCAVYYKQLWQLIRHPFQKKVYLLLLATAITGGLGVLLKDRLETLFGGSFLGFGFLLTTLVLLLCEYLGGGKKKIEEMTYPESAGVGLLQAVAMIPGLSRSGSTIAGGRFFGLSRAEAADFSFILSIPVILGSVLLEGKDALEEGLAGVTVLPLLVGMLVAGVSGYLAIRFMLKLVRKRSLKGFAYYTAALGVLVLLDQFVTHVFF